MPILTEEPEVSKFTFGKTDQRIVDHLAETGEEDLWNRFGYPEDSAVKKIADATGLDENDIYYSLKFLKSLYLFDEIFGGLDLERVEKIKRNGPPQEGFVDLKECLLARAERKEPKSIDLDSLPVASEARPDKNRNTLGKIIKSATEKIDSQPSLPLVRKIESALRRNFSDDPSEPETPRVFRKLLSKCLDDLGQHQLEVIIPALQTELRKIAPKLEDTFPVALGPAALSGLVGEFVSTALPYTEADAQCLAFQFLTAVGNVLGRGNYVHFGTDRHYSSLFSVVLGSTSAGKGQGLSVVRSFLRTVDPIWEGRRCKYSAASGEAIVRLASESENDNRLCLIVPELSTLLNSMDRQGSTTSGHLRLGYDGLPLENNRARASEVAQDYLMSVIGHITPAELSEIISQVDWFNGVSNRFIWAAVRKSKTLPRMNRLPAFGPLTQKLKRLLELPTVGAIEFSEEAGEVWDSWVHSLPADEEENATLAASQQRIRPNALRIALIYASLDERRLVFPTSSFQIQPGHVKAAIEVVSHSRAAVEWFLRRPMKIGPEMSYQDVVKFREAMNKNGGQISGTELYELFKHKTADERTSIASRAGAKLKKISQEGRRGTAGSIWAWS